MPATPSRARIGARGPRPRLPRARSASAPTASRGASATLVRRGGDRLLIDCGEGTQRQLLRSDAGLVDLEHVFLTHLHADHVLGLPGMLKTFSLRGREVPITVYGPRGHAIAAGRARGRDRPADVPARDRRARRGGRRSSFDEYRVETFAVAHGRNALGYALREDEPAGPVRRRRRGSARRARRSRARRAAAWRARAASDDGRVVQPEEVARAAAARPDGRAQRRHRPTASVVGRGSGRRRARPRGDVPRRRARSGARDGPFDGGGGGRSSHATPMCSARAHAPVSPGTPGAEVADEATEVFPAPSSRGTST